MPQTRITVRAAQQALLRTASELQALDGRLAVLADSIETAGGRALPGELRGVTQCVRTDLLRDAIHTLEALGRATEQSVVEHRLEVDAAARRIAAFG